VHAFRPGITGSVPFSLAEEAFDHLFDWLLYDLNYKVTLPVVEFPKPVIGHMAAIKLHLGAKTDNKLIWLDPDTNSIKARIYDVEAKFYTPDTVFYVLNATLDARVQHAHLDITLQIQ
jgi:hypothetical protein